jgi:hypothetical protein
MQVMMIQNFLMKLWKLNSFVLFFVMDDGCVNILQKDSNKVRLNKYVQDFIQSSPRNALVKMKNSFRSY